MSRLGAGRQCSPSEARDVEEAGSQGGDHSGTEYSFPLDAETA